MTLFTFRLAQESFYTQLTIFHDFLFFADFIFPRRSSKCVCVCDLCHSRVCACACVAFAISSECRSVSGACVGALVAGAGRRCTYTVLYFYSFSPTVGCPVTMVHVARLHPAL